jgi:hypothetical protein
MDFPSSLLPHLDIGRWTFVIGYSPLFSIAIAIVIAIVIGLPPSTDLRLPITDYFLSPAAVSAAINSQAMLERGHQFSSYA